MADTDVIQLATNIKTAMTGNAAFTTPTPSLTSIGTAITTAQTALTTALNAQVAAKSATATKDAAITALKTALTQLATYVGLTANGSETTILSSGMAVQSAKTPSAVPDQVTDLSITTGDNNGELDLQWDTVSGAKSYEVQLSPDPMTSTSFVSQPSVTKSRAAIIGLTSGAKMWARVRAVSAGGQGAWSDPATKIVP